MCIILMKNFPEKCCSANFLCGVFRNNLTIDVSAIKGATENSLLYLILIKNAGEIKYSVLI